MAEPTVGVPIGADYPRGSSLPFPLGVRSGLPQLPDGGTNVSVFAPGLVAVDVFWEADGSWHRRHLTDGHAGIHHAPVPGLRYGARYGFWPQGQDLPGEPGSFQLLLDPYARGIETAPGPDGGQLLFSVHTSPKFDWGGAPRPHVPWRSSVIYEAHVKGLTMLHPEVPPELRGTYAGLAHPAVTGYLRDLGVTAVELLPIHFHTDEPHLQDLGLSNYWGYNTAAFFAPHSAYATEEARRRGAQGVQDEVKAMVRDLHRAGLEVILDVVFNHTAEGRQGWPALSFRGLGEGTYYRHDHEGRYLDVTGCGNTLDFSEPRVVQLALDSLRYWVNEYHVDGFRFDLAPALARGADHRYDRRHPFLVACAADETLQSVKLISEPWDIGPDGWQTGNFPPGWADWNDRFRDSVRDFWIADQGTLHAGGQGGSVARIAGALAGSADLFAGSGRTPLASLNFVTAHDGFTLRDLTSYNGKHNEANGEGNRDGSDHNRSWNHGVEGPTDDPDVRSRRLQTARNVMATLALSLGVPMLTAGDEFGRTQRGNNNAYSQDNEISWVDWNLDEDGRALLRDTRRLLRLREQYLRTQPFHFPADSGSSHLLWFDADGQPMVPEKWEDPGNRVLQLVIAAANGELAGLVVLNGHLEDRQIVLPDAAALRSSGADIGPGRRYEPLFSTASSADRRGSRMAGGDRDRIPANSLAAYKLSGGPAA